MRSRTLLFLSAVVVIISSCENRTSTENEKHPVAEIEKTTPSSANTAIPVDIDGNVYDTVRIGTQVWMKENLRTSHYRDGSPITEIEDNQEWQNIHETRSETPAWCYYKSDTANNHKYGKLYNWYAVVDPRNICPPGWHIPSQVEWQHLTDALGGEAAAGGKMKAKKLWRAPNTDATNSSGFTALPSETRYLHGGFSDSDLPGYCCTFWSSTEEEGGTHDFAHAYSLGSASSYLDNSTIGTDKSSGFSVRCIRDSN